MGVEMLLEIACGYCYAHNVDVVTGTCNTCGTTAPSYKFRVKGQVDAVPSVHRMRQYKPKRKSTDNGMFDIPVDRT